MHLSEHFYTGGCPEFLSQLTTLNGLKLTKKDRLRDVEVFGAGVENEQYLLAASYYNCHGPTKMGMRGSNLFKRVFLGVVMLLMLARN